MIIIDLANIPKNVSINDFLSSSVFANINGREIYQYKFNPITREWFDFSTSKKVDLTKEQIRDLCLLYSPIDPDETI